MPRYSPLPSIPLDPRNEAEIVQAASQRVYQASGQTLNDFSSGNPLAALLEGMAFSQGEFLYWANQLPQSVLIEWIGPFLGAMRRLGTPAAARLQVTLPPSLVTITIPEGTVFTTNPEVTGGETFSFLATEDLVIPAGETLGYVSVASKFVGSIYNCSANAITGIAVANVEGLSVTNLQPAVGGSDVETYEEVQERFFTLIRRKNPVSGEDWQDFFVDFYGVGTQTSVQPNRPSQGAYNYYSDYLKPNGQVSFFVLGPNGVELNQEQLRRGQNAINYSLPLENEGHLYPITLSQVQYNLTVEVDATGAFGGNLRDSSRNFRDRIFSILQPGQVFPSNVDPEVSSVEAAFYNTFDSSTRFRDPMIVSSAAYNTPPLLEQNSATYTNVYAFSPNSTLLSQNDLVQTTVPTSKFYPVTTGFTPYSDKKKDQTIYGNLKLQQILELLPGSYSQGQVVSWVDPVTTNRNLHVVLGNINVGTLDEVPGLISKGSISVAKSYSAWTTGNVYTSQVAGSFNPELIQYDYATPISGNVSADGQFVPTYQSSIPLELRPGAFVWVVAQDFTLQASTDSVPDAQTASVLGTPVTPLELVPGNSYTAGTWVYTPQIGSGPNPVADPYFNYVDTSKGVVNKYAYVIESFTYTLDSFTVSTYFDNLVEEGVIREIVVNNADSGLPIYKYSPRFPAQTYLEYRSNSGAKPEYYVASRYFTPSSNNIQTLLANGDIFPLYLNETDYASLVVALSQNAIKSTRMFRFFKGDQTFFRQGNKIISYTATESVHPLFQFYIYQSNGVFVETSTYSPDTYIPQPYIPFFDPSYNEYSEDTILSADGKNYYRVMNAFTPTATVINWTGTTVTNTARIEEYAGNLLRYVDRYDANERIRSQLGRDVSAIKLGVGQITVIPRNSGRGNNSQQQAKFVWENTATATATPQLSWYSGTTYKYNPPDYAGGTLRL